MEKANNMYYEQVRKSLSQFSPEVLVERIKVYQEIVDKLGSDALWRTVMHDAEIWVKQVDAQWHDTVDEKQLAYLRTMKIAYNHLLELPAKYKVHLKTAQDLLKAQNNTGVSIQKDYDNETNLEPQEALDAYKEEIK